MIEMRDNGPEAKIIYESADKGKSRSVYLPLLRGVTPQSLEAFDPVDQTLVTGRRDATVVPAQALFLLNSSFVRRQALAIAERVLASKTGDDAGRIDAAYRLTLGRTPISAEVRRAHEFLAEYAAEYRVDSPLKPAVKSEKPGPAKPPPANPDEVEQAGEVIVEVDVRPKDARTAAWMALAQALIGSAEFRYLK